MSTKTVDINKPTIMKMLQVDLFGFQPSAAAIEEKAKEVHHLVSGQGGTSNLRMIGGYGRNANGFIVLIPTKADEPAASGKKKKK